MLLENHPLLPTLVQQFAGNDPAFHHTARILYNRGAAPTEIMCALAMHAHPHVPQLPTQMGSDLCIVAPDFAALYRQVTPSSAEYTPPNGVRLVKFVRTPAGDWEAPTLPRFAPVPFSRTFIIPDAILSRLFAAIPLREEDRETLRTKKPGEGFLVHGKLLVALSSRAEDAVVADGSTRTAMVVFRARVKEYDPNAASDFASKV